MAVTHITIVLISELGTNIPAWDSSKSVIFSLNSLKDFNIVKPSICVRHQVVLTRFLPYSCRYHVLQRNALVINK